MSNRADGQTASTGRDVPGGPVRHTPLPREHYVLVEPLPTPPTRAPQSRRTSRPPGRYDTLIAAAVSCVVVVSVLMAWVTVAGVEVLHPGFLAALAVTGLTGLLTKHPRVRGALLGVSGAAILLTVFVCALLFTNLLGVLFTA